MRGSGTGCSRASALLVRAAVLLFIAFVMFGSGSSSVRAAETKSAAGLALTFSVAGQQDVAIAPNVALHVEHGQSPTPFLPGGRFTAVWHGALRAELRGNYFFQAEVSGALTVEINGAVVLETAGAASPTPLSQPVQLNKGANPFQATFTAPAQGDAMVRLGWTEKPPFSGPIPDAAFTHAVTPELELSAQLRLGRALFLDHRCHHCHVDPKLAHTGAMELRMDAPSLEGIGARRHYDWMARWILDPKSLRPAALMPKLLAGPKAREEAEAIAAFLASLKTGGEVKLPDAAYQTQQPALPGGEGAASAGEPAPLYERLYCAGCHNPPDAKAPDPTKLSQTRIAEKFPPGKLAEYLRAPEAHYAWTRMPNFHLSGKEARELEDWLLAAAPKPSLVAAPSDPALLERGRKLVQTTGCLNCHSLKLENQFQAPPLDALAGRQRKDRSKAPAGDCLGPTPLADFSLTAAQRAALEAFTARGLVSLARHVPAEFAERQVQALNCAACHGQVDLVPPLAGLGGRLQPEWAAKFLAGDIPHKIRYDAHPRGEPWVAARMPAFKSRAASLAAGLAQLHGYAPKSPAEPPVDAARAEIGRKLVGKDGGFSCVSCHGVGPSPAMEVFESEGVNLAYSADRLQPDFYRRWLRAPTSIDPQTKMPVYFDDGKSPLTDVLDGDAEKQITAIWEYLKLRDKMPPPRTGAE
jgi:mono/diheme cytochrome c family protein